jgi:hypothetical protein
MLSATEPCSSSWAQPQTQELRALKRSARRGSHFAILENEAAHRGAADGEASGDLGLARALVKQAENLLRFERGRAGAAEVAAFAARLLDARRHARAADLTARSGFREVSGPTGKPGEGSASSPGLPRDRTGSSFRLTGPFQPSLSRGPPSSRASCYRSAHSANGGSRRGSHRLYCAALRLRFREAMPDSSARMFRNPASGAGGPPRSPDRSEAGDLQDARHGPNRNEWPRSAGIRHKLMFSAHAEDPAHSIGCARRLRAA